jgi:hypothetical protein
MLQKPSHGYLLFAAPMPTLPSLSCRALVQEATPGALDRPEIQSKLTTNLNAGLEALSQIDLVLAATENAELDPSAFIWKALANREDSVRQALDLEEAEVAVLADGRKRSIDLGSVAPLSVALFGVVTGLREGYKSVLFEVCSRYRRSRCAPSTCAESSTALPCSYSFNTHAMQCGL